MDEKRKARRKQTQECFTPREVLDVMFQSMDEELYSDFTKTFLDPCVGTGNIFLYVLERRLKYCKCAADILKAISTMYATELMEDNVQECKENILKLLENHEFDIVKVKEILNNNIVCTNTFNWDYEKWEPKQL